VPTFGLTDETTTSGLATIEGAIRGGIFTMGATGGTADSISVYIVITGSASTTFNLKCAIYKASDLSLVGQTDEMSNIDGTEADQWRTLTFSSPPPLEASTEYLLVAWASAVAVVSVQIRVDTSGGATKYHARTGITYDGNFPDPSGTTELDTDTDIPIYCTYTETTGVVRLLGSTGVGK
jgi:hypothetical protein